MKHLVNALIAALVLVAGPAAAAETLATRTQVETLLSTQLPSGSSPHAVQQFLDQRKVAHGAPQQKPPGAFLLATFTGLKGDKPHSAMALQVRFSFLQDRLIGYSFTELPAAP